tara:strand:+ start:124 stop:1413 length:1290 start_codon:yes stop_codon:yes gene_type:complete
MAKVFKEEQEKCSIIATYYAIEENANLEPDKDTKLKSVFTQVYPNMPEDWYVTFLNQAQAIKNKIGDNNWKYGWYDGTQGWASGIMPNNKVSYIMGAIWNIFTDKQKKVFGSQKDSWNTADVFVVNAQMETEILRFVKQLQDDFQDFVSPQIFIGTLNSYLSELIRNNDLVPISLKKQTKNAPVRVKETNVDDVPVEGLVPFDGEFLAKPYSYFDIVNRGSKLNFTGNSLFYKASFQVGSYPYFYQIEQRMQGNSSKAEVKDLVVKGNKGKRGPADAQTGNVPMPQFKALVFDYTGEEYDHNIPAIGSEINVKYWSDYIETIYKDAKDDFDFGKFTIFGKTYTPKEFMEFAIRLDKLSDDKIKILYNISKNAFSAKLRNKLRHLRTIKAYLKAQKDNKLSEFFMVIYFRAAKMNITDKDLVSPFLKVSS